MGGRLFNLSRCWFPYYIHGWLASWCALYAYLDQLRLTVICFYLVHRLSCLSIQTGQWPGWFKCGGLLKCCVRIYLQCWDIYISVNTNLEYQPTCQNAYNPHNLPIDGIETFEFCSTAHIETPETTTVAWWAKQYKSKLNFPKRQFNFTWRYETILIYPQLSTRIYFTKIPGLDRKITFKIWIIPLSFWTLHRWWKSVCHRKMELNPRKGKSNISWHYDPGLPVTRSALSLLRLERLRSK